MIVSVYLYTTPGCFACNVMSKIIKSEDVANNPNITAITEEIITFGEYGKEKAKELGIKDFPTTRFINEFTNEIEGELVGTYPIDFVNKTINKITNYKL